MNAAQRPTAPPRLPSPPSAILDLTKHTCVSCCLCSLNETEYHEASQLILLHILLGRFCTRCLPGHSTSAGYESAAACELALTITSSELMNSLSLAACKDGLEAIQSNFKRALVVQDDVALTFLVKSATVTGLKVGFAAGFPYALSSTV